MLEVKNIHKKFGSNEVLKGVDFKVEKGSVIAVLGNSGSGKTTLLRCISFLEQADQGEITFDDFQKDITAVTRKEIKELRMKMGFVFQGYNLFRNKTALQNVLEGLTAARKISVKAAQKRAMEMLGKVGMENRANFYPDQLSGGSAAAAWPLQEPLPITRKWCCLMSPHLPWIQGLPGKFWILCGSWRTREPPWW